MLDFIIDCFAWPFIIIGAIPGTIIYYLLALFFPSLRESNGTSGNIGAWFCLSFICGLVICITLIGLGLYLLLW